MTKTPDNPPPADPQATGKPTAKRRPGAPRGNQNRTRSGRFKAKTETGRVRFKDEFTKAGAKIAGRVWRDYGYPKSPLRNALATKEATILRLQDQTGDTKPADRTGELREAFRTLMFVTGERDRLLERLEHRFRPDLNVAKPVEERRHVRVAIFSDGRAVFGSPVGIDGVREREMSAHDRRLAIEALGSANLSTTDANVIIWWAGRLWNAHGVNRLKIGEAAESDSSFTEPQRADLHPGGLDDLVDVSTLNTSSDPIDPLTLAIPAATLPATDVGATTEGKGTSKPSGDSGATRGTNNPCTVPDASEAATIEPGAPIIKSKSVERRPAPAPAPDPPPASVLVGPSKYLGSDSHRKDRDFG